MFADFLAKKSPPDGRAYAKIYYAYLNRFGDLFSQTTIIGEAMKSYD